LERGLKVPEIADMDMDEVGLFVENLVHKGRGAGFTAREVCVEAVVLQYSQRVIQHQLTEE
jgi:hypothetical protein